MVLFYSLIVYSCSLFFSKGILYAERLKKAGVDVNLAFYEHAFHGIIGFTQPYLGFNIAIDIQNDLFMYLEKNL
jgi:acetyl esterase/lipase